MDYAEAGFWIEVGTALFTVSFGYVIWAGGGFDILHPELIRTKWGILKLRRIVRRALHLRTLPGDEPPVNDFAPKPTQEAPIWLNAK